MATPYYTPKKIPELTEDNKSYIRKNYDKVDVTTLAKHVSGNPKASSKDVWGTAIKQYIATLGAAPIIKGSKFDPVQPPNSGVVVKPMDSRITIDLTPEQKILIANNIDSVSSPLEMTLLAFSHLSEEQKKQITSSSEECAAVTRHMKEVRPSSVNPDDELVEDREFRPPVSLNQIVGWCNHYITDGPGYNSDPKNLKKFERDRLMALMGYMKTLRFIYQASSYKKVKERELFISTFIRWCHDKEDLAPEEVDQYIGAAAETVSIAKIERTINRFEELVEADLSGGGSGGEGVELSLKKLESINQYRAKLDTSKGRLKTMLGTLTQDRSDRLKNQLSRNYSVIPLIEAWSSEQRRLEMIAMAELEQASDANEYKRLESADDLLCLIAGMGQNEASHGI